MRRSKRKSTIDKSQQIENLIAHREERKRLKALRAKDNPELIQLAGLVPNNSNTEVDTSNKDTSEGEVFTSGTEDEYWIDQSNQELSGVELTSPVSPFPVTPSDPDSWSVTVNRFSSDSNLLDSLRRESLQLSFLPQLKPQVGVPVEPTIDNVFDFVPQNTSDRSNSGDSSVVTVREMASMDEDAFFEELIKLENVTEDIDTLISRFNKDTVSLLDIGSFRDELKIIFDKFTDFQKAYQTVKGKLDRRKPADVPKLTQIKELFDKYQKRVVDNEVLVKKKLQDLQSADTSSKTKDTDNLEQDKLKLKLTHAEKKFKDFSKLIEDLEPVEDMSERTIRENLLEAKDWKKDLKTYRDLKENIDLELLSIDIDEAVQTSFVEVYDKMVDLVTKKMAELCKADKELGLFALSESKTKSSVHYPEPFTGSLGENVYKFVKAFKDAIESDQIRKADEVKTLMKYLKGNAKSTIGEHHLSLNNALDQLTDNYGSPRLIVDKYLKDYEKAHGQVRQWGKHGSKDRIDAINRTLDFLRNLETLCADHPDHLRSEIYSSTTLTLITKGMPYELTKKLNERCSQKDPYECWFTTLFDIIEENKSTNLSALSTGIGALKSVSKDHDSTSSKSNQLKHNGHDCSKSNSCKEKWDLLGCSHLYKLSTVEERQNFLRERRACFRCGRSPFLVRNQGKHICNWKDGKMNARCLGKVATGARCWNGAAMCLEHPDNASDILIDWLKAQKIQFTVNVIVASSDTSQFCTDEDYYDRLMSEMNTDSSHKINTKPKDRGSLQSGEAAQMMNDEEIFEFFTSDMRKIRSKSKLHKIPEGEAVFILTVVKGRVGPVMTFVDSGANCWLAEEGIPEREFISVKLDHGPIPLSVAGGNTTYASGEYASLLPLADCSFQCVRGLTLKQVTGTMPELNLVPVFEQLKASVECSNNQRIQNLKVPKKLGGNIQMLLGIKYQNIFPKILHTFPSGLTVFESKLMPAASGALVCIGGPISCLDHICENAGASSTLSYMANLTQNLGSYTKLEFFPSNDLDLSEISRKEFPEFSCIECGVNLVQSDLEKFMKLQDAGLDTNYKCPKCRNCPSCIKGSGHELLSMKEEFQQQVIEESVVLDDELGKVVAFLAFVSDPAENLNENEHIAICRLQNVCKK